MEKPKCSLVPVSPMQAPAASAAIDDDFIKSRIFTIRVVQVVLDRDLAELYGVATKALNQAVRRNSNRFPEEFMFTLSKDETDELVTNCDRFLNMRHSSVPAHAFSEHGVIMVASVLKSEIAAGISVQIARAFVSMRRALASIAPMLTRLDAVERRQITDQVRNEARFETIFKVMDGGDFPPQKIFYDGQLWDARAFVDRLVKSARKSLLLVNNFSRMPPRDSSRAAFVVSSLRSAPLSFGTGGTCSRRPVSSSSRRPRPLAAAAPRAAAIPIRPAPVACRRARCRVSRFGASLKDLGKKCFGFTRMDPAEIPGLKARL